MDIEKLFDRQEKILDEIGHIKIVLTKQELNLSEHMRRTQLAEENIELLREELKPIQNHVKTVDIVIKLAGGISALVSFGLGLIKLFELILK